MLFSELLRCLIMLIHLLPTCNAFKGKKAQGKTNDAGKGKKNVKNTPASKLNIYDDLIEIVPVSLKRFII